MKYLIHRIFLKLLLLTIFLPLSVSADIIHLMPTPHSLQRVRGQFSLHRSISIVMPDSVAIVGGPRVAAELSELVVEGGGKVVAKAHATIVVRMVASVRGARFQEEAYHLTVNLNTIMIEAATRLGALRAAQTLRQLAEGRRGSIAGCDITDWAAFRVRGYMHDIGRSYIPFERLKEEVVALARYKVNVFQWHLTDNQGWRLQSDIYPQLNADSSFTRFPGQYYTKAQVRELVTLASSYGITVIPELDMPGHSEAFRRAMGHSMVTVEGLNELKNLLTEASETFSGTPWMHIGTDEYRVADKPLAGQHALDLNTFVSEIVAHLKSLGRKVMAWSPGVGDKSVLNMTQMWSGRGRPTPGVPAIDSRYHYINHFDTYADLALLYGSTIAEQQEGSAQYAGVIMGMWNDRLMPSYESIITQNNFYASMLAAAERGWLGGGKGYFTNKGVRLSVVDTDFFDWERRFLYHKAHFLQGKPINYVKQTNVKWLITDAFPNNGDLTMKFPPETEELKSSYTYQGKVYGTHSALGATVFLRHYWGEKTVPGFFEHPQSNTTAYAYTYVYSPVKQMAGAQIEFYNYGRSEADVAPRQGKWDYRESRIWVNDAEITPPKWQNTYTERTNERPLLNENFSARKPIGISLNKGWNKILIKLPNNGFEATSATRLAKWMFTFVLTNQEGTCALDNVIYSPTR